MIKDKIVKTLTIIINQKINTGAMLTVPETTHTNF